MIRTSSRETCHKCGRFDYRDYMVKFDTTGHGERIEYVCDPPCRSAYAQAGLPPTYREIAVVGLLIAMWLALGALSLVAGAK